MVYKHNIKEEIFPLLFYVQHLHIINFKPQFKQEVCGRKHQQTIYEFSTLNCVSPFEFFII